MCNTATYLHLTHQMTAKKTNKTNKQFWQLGIMVCLYTFCSFLFLLISMKTVVTSTGMSQGPWLWNRFSSLLAATPEMGKEDLRPRKSRESPMKIPWVWRFSEILETFGCPISGFPLLGQYEILTMGVGKIWAISPKDARDHWWTPQLHVRHVFIQVLERFTFKCVPVGKWYPWLESLRAEPSHSTTWLIGFPRFPYEL